MVGTPLDHSLSHGRDTLSFEQDQETAKELLLAKHCEIFAWIESWQGRWHSNPKTDRECLLARTEAQNQLWVFKDCRTKKKAGGRSHINLLATKIYIIQIFKEALVQINIQY